MVLDAALHREPWAASAARVLNAVATGRVRGWLAAHAVTTVYYVIDKERGRAAATTAVADVSQVLPVVPIGAPELQRALSLGLPDYEDAVQVIAALHAGADYIVTRNERDFRSAPVPPRSPAEVLALL